MNENEIMNLELLNTHLLQLIGMINSDTETVFKYFDLLLWVKNSIELNIDNPEALNMIQFTYRNIVDILSLLSRGNTSVYYEFYSMFIDKVIRAIELDETKGEMKYSLIQDKINSLSDEKTNVINTMYNHGMTILRVSFE